MGLLFAMGNFAGFILGIFLSLIVRGENKGESAGGLGFCFGVFLIGLVLIYFMKEERNRMNYDKEQSDIRKSGVFTDGDKTITIIPSDPNLKERLLEINPDEDSKH